jgi:nicotinamide-nucleotide amidase
MPRSATVIPNANGSAPGVHWSRDGCEIFLLPGVPNEMQAMLLEWIVPRLRSLFPHATLEHVAVFRTTGIGESTLLERIQSVIDAAAPLRWAFYPSWHGVDVRVSGESEDDAAFAAQWRNVKNSLRSILGEYLYSEDPHETLAAAVGHALERRGETLATAESCTGGLLGKLMTDVPGSSAWYQGGFVTYSNELKQQLLNVPRALLAEHGAVSAEVAAAMAAAARRITGTTYGVSLTGIAGPTGGTAEKPVGLVFVALSTADGVRVRRFQFGKDRHFNREIASQRAIDLVRRHQDGLPCGDLLES